MIKTLYVFSPGSFVDAKEWNANFKVLYEGISAHIETIQDAQNTIAFNITDLTASFQVMDSQPNSFIISGTSRVVQRDCEYYKALASGEDLDITVPSGFNGEARIIIKTTNSRVSSPITFDYGGGESNVVWYNGIAQWYNPGMKFVFICERGGKLFVKMITTE